MDVRSDAYACNGFVATRGRRRWHPALRVRAAGAQPANAAVRPLELESCLWACADCRNRGAVPNGRGIHAGAARVLHDGGREGVPRYPAARTSIAFIRLDKPDQFDIFGIAGLGDIGNALVAAGRWPDQRRFPVNLPGRTVRDQVLNDLKDSAEPLVVTGYASLDRIIDLLADLHGRDNGRMRLVLGNEPFESRRKSFVLAHQPFTEQVRSYWLERGISLHLSAKLLVAINEMKAGRLEARFVDDPVRRLHAKLYVGDRAATLGSSNFTQAGLTSQLECNARFTAEAESRRFGEARMIATYYWSVGHDFTPELLSLLEALLRVVTW